MDIREKIAVMQAFTEGKKIEGRSKDSLCWRDAPNPSWNWAKCNYRVKPEPEELWIMRSADGRVLYCSENEPNRHIVGSYKLFREVVE